MKMNDELTKAFNDQIAVELASSLAYLQMSAHFAEKNLVGMASWARLQAEEEWEHALQFFDFVLARGNAVTIADPGAPPAEFEGVESVFAAALAQERQVTKAIHDLYRKAHDQGDLACVPFLQGFISEQNEEEDMVDTILDRVRLAGDSPGALLLLDHELGSRTTAG